MKDIRSICKLETLTCVNIKYLETLSQQIQWDDASIFIFFAKGIRTQIAPS